MFKVDENRRSVWLPVEVVALTVEDAVGFMDAIEGKGCVIEVRYEGYRTEDGTVRIKAVIGVCFGAAISSAQFVAGLGMLFYGMGGVTILRHELAITQTMYGWINIAESAEESIGNGTFARDELEEERHGYDGWIHDRRNRSMLFELIRLSWLMKIQLEDGMLDDEEGLLYISIMFAREISKGVDVKAAWCLMVSSIR